MQFKHSYILLVCVMLSACARPGYAGAPVSTETFFVPPTTTSLPITETALPSQTTIPTITPDLSPILSPTPAISRIGITATVWITDPLVPILTYHQFIPGNTGASNAVKSRLDDFQNELQTLYDRGFSLVSLESWLNGNLVVARDRRPLILTMDDLYFNDQLTLTPEGEPDPETGIGVLWQFYRAHPDFGFHIALFATLGDKLYANPDDPKWQDYLAQAIAWGIEHDAKPYNHTYTHAMLDKNAPADILWQLQMNDNYLRRLLERIKRQDLIDQLGNMLAIPYGRWPASQAGINTLLNYTSPEGVPMQAILEIDYYYRAKYLPPPYAASFDRYHIPRIVGSVAAVEYLAEIAEDFTTARQCALGSIEEGQPVEVEYLNLLINSAVKNHRCPYGVYIVQGFLFDVKETGIEILNLK